MSIYISVCGRYGDCHYSPPAIWSPGVGGRGGLHDTASALASFRILLSSRLSSTIWIISHNGFSVYPIAISIKHTVRLTWFRSLYRFLKCTVSGQAYLLLNRSVRVSKPAQHRPQSYYGFKVGPGRFKPWFSVPLWFSDLRLVCSQTCVCIFHWNVYGSQTGL